MQAEQGMTDSGGGGVVLVADDGRVVRSCVARSLRTTGYRTVICTNGREALDRLRAGAARVAFVDVSMPEMTGIEMCRELRRDAEHRYWLCGMSGDARNEEPCLKAGFDAFVPKPFPREVLLRYVREGFAAMTADGADHVV